MAAPPTRVCACGSHRVVCGACGSGWAQVAARDEVPTELDEEDQDEVPTELVEADQVGEALGEEAVPKVAVRRAPPWVVPSLAEMCHKRLLAEAVSRDPYLNLTDYLDVLVSLCRSRGVGVYSHDDLIISQATEGYWELAIRRHQVMSEVPDCSSAEERARMQPWAVAVKRRRLL